MNRDFAAEVRAIIDAETADGPYVSRQVAEHIVAKLEATDAELLDGWLHAQAVQLIWQTINDRDRSTRGHIRRTAARGVFGAASERHTAGDGHAMVQFLGMPFTVDGVRKRLADLTGPDLSAVAGDYERRAADNAMTAAFLRALGKKVREDAVADHFTEQQLGALWSSLTRT